MISFLLKAFSLLLILFTACTPHHAINDQPNVIVFLADDLGYGETGIYGQKKIKTPNIDALASQGMLFTQFYSGAPVCAPARYILLTGKHAGHAYIRGNDEWTERGDVWDYVKASSDPSLEGQRPIPAATVTIGKLLQKSGYITGIFGKWGLGAPGTDGVPDKQGFDYFFGYNCQRQAHNLYPPHLWENDQEVVLNNEIVPPGTPLDSLADPFDDSSYKKYEQTDYAPALIHDKALSFLEKNKDHPFFMYYATPLPHLPLQIPAKEREFYHQQFGEEQPYKGDHGYFPNRYPRAAYAAMITYLDKQLGELVGKLKELGIYKNTVIFFTSDNGPTYLGGVDVDYFDSAHPFSNEYGRTKGFVYEGGIRVPMIASWPGHIKADSKSSSAFAFYDLLPTICQLTDTHIPMDIDGISMAPTLLGQQQKNEHAYLYWEFPSYHGQQAVRMGQWKGIRKNIFDGNMAIELYNLENDPGETQNLAEQYPEIISSMDSIMKVSHRPARNAAFKFKQLGDP